MDTNSKHFSIFVAVIVWIFLFVLQPSLVIYWGFFAVPLLTLSMFSENHTDEGQQCFLSNTEPSLSSLLIWFYRQSSFISHLV
jgi:hypothetical protein